LNRTSLLAGLIAAAFAVGFVSAVVRADHSSSLIGLLAIDANVEGNTATSIGPVDGCARVEPGSQINVDYVVDAIPQDRPIIAFEVQVRYNPELLTVVAVDYDLMLAAVGDYQPFAGGDLTDELPDSDGDYRLVVLDMASQSEIRDPPRTGPIVQPEANVERGKGVLARITLQAKAPGVSEVTVGYDPQNGGPYPLTQDTENETIIVDKLGGASVAIGQDCPPEAVAPKIIDPPNTEAEIFGGTPPPGAPGGATIAPATPTPEGQTPTPEGQTPTPEGQTPEPGGRDGDTPLIPCPVRALPTPASTPVPSPAPTEAVAPAGESPAPATDTSPTPPVTEPPSPTGTPAPELCTPTPTPIEEVVADVEGESNAGLVVGAIALLGLGSAAAGGGWYMFRRRNGAA
jgi:hypothetical protein